MAEFKQAEELHADKNLGLGFVNVSVKDANGHVHRIGGLSLSDVQTEYMKKNNIKAGVHRGLAKALAENKAIEFVVTTWIPGQSSDGDEDVQF